MTEIELEQTFKMGQAKNIGRVLTAIFFITIFVVGVIATLTNMALNVEISTMLDVSSLPACATEDSTDCYWNAAANGNGAGQDFIDYNGETYYLAK